MSDLILHFEKYKTEDIEEIFLTVEDLIFHHDHKNKNIILKFMQSLVQQHPLMIKLQGKKIFKFIRRTKDSEAATRFKV